MPRGWLRLRDGMSRPGKQHLLLATRHNDQGEPQTDHNQYKSWSTGTADTWHGRVL
jgi:hypothetical protein